jgi:hypothetical protein
MGGVGDYVRQLISAGAAVTLAACTLQYPHQMLEPEDAVFAGVLRAADEPQTQRTLIWVHGMCYHDEKWVKERAGVFRKAGAGVTEIGSETVDHLGRTVHIWTYRVRFNDEELVVKFIVWADLTLHAKARLCFDVRDDAEAKKMCKEAGAVPGFPYDRAPLNELLKSRIMDACLADAMLYAGPAKDPIRDGLAKGVCTSLSTTDNQKKSCREAPYQWPVAGGPVFVISESLSSKILFDTFVRAIKAGSPEAVAQLLFQSPDRMRGHLYMLANQIPILDLADPGIDIGISATAAPIRTTPLERALQLLRRPSLTAVAKDVQLKLVAFSDPNDVLSYRIPVKYFTDPGIETVNALSSNAATLVGYVERPDEAHMNYVLNRRVIRGLLCGHPARPSCPVR